MANKIGEYIKVKTTLFEKNIKSEERSNSENIAMQCKNIKMNVLISC
jgi:hypothetical protein